MTSAFLLKVITGQSLPAKHAGDFSFLMKLPLYPLLGSCLLRTAAIRFALATTSISLCSANMTRTGLRHQQR